MIKKIFTIVFVLLLGASFMYAGNVIGTVTDSDGAPLQGANVILKGNSIGSATDANGKFAINNVSSGTYTLVVSFIGYQQHSEEINVTDATLEVNVSLAETQILGEQVIVSASKKVEKITDAPATIGLISAKEIEEIPGNAGELLGRVKGVDYVRTGVVGIGINVRGFNSAFNPKNLQMNDNRLSTLIATGLGFGPLSTTVKDDIERIEVILGPAAALYGPNAHNGLVNTIQKDPRRYPGTTIALAGGSQSVLNGRFRHAQVLSDKFAFKVSGEYTQGTEFDYTDSVYIGGKAFDELEVDRDFNSMRGEAAMYFSPTSESDIILSYGGSKNNYLSVTNAGRNQIKDWMLHVFQLRYVSPRIFGQVYYTLSSTEDTYAINQRTQNYWTFINAGFSEEEAKSRSLSEQWSAAAGVGIDRGPIFKDDSKRLNSEIQYNNNWGGFNVIVGGQYQLDMAGSKGTYLLDNNSTIDLAQYGFYVQIEKEIANGFKFVGATRADDHEFYGFNFIPKAGLLHSSDIGTFRLTYGMGIAAPTILNMSMDLFGGLVLGNGEGFTMTDGSKIAPLEVETINTIELGYKGVVNKKLYIDANAYYNMSENFISPLTNIADAANGNFITHRGTQDINELQALGGAVVLSYLNFGNVNTYGFDLGFNYYANENINVSVNYSFFDFNMDTDDLKKNDGNKDGKVDENDLPLNTPTHKGSFLVGYHKDKFFGTIFARFTQAYNFFSGINVASETIPGLKYGGADVVEGQVVGRDFNEGPLGGVVNIDLTLGYKVSDMITASVHVTNVLDSEVRDFVASPAIGRLITGEVKLTF